MVPEMSRIQGGDAHAIILLGNFGSSIIHHPSQKDTHQIVLSTWALMIRISQSRLIWLIRIHSIDIYGDFMGWLEMNQTNKTGPRLCLGVFVMTASR